MKYLENIRKPVKVKHGCPTLLICTRVTPLPRRFYVHYVSYMCMPCTSDLDDVRVCIYPFHIYIYIYMCEVLAVYHMQMVIIYMIRVKYVLRGPLDHMTFQSNGVRIIHFTHVQATMIKSHDQLYHVTLHT